MDQATQLQRLSNADSERIARLARLGRPQRTIAKLLGVGKGTVAREIERLGLRRAA